MPAMRATLLLPVVVLAIAALAALLVRPFDEDEETSEAVSTTEEVTA